MISIQKYKINEFAAITVLALYYYSFKNDYINSKFWLGIPQNVITALIPLQILAAVGGLIWYISIRENPPDIGLLSYNIFNNPVYDILVFFFLLGSILWPISLMQHELIENKTLLKSLLCCSGLFIAAISGILLQAGSFEANNITPLALAGITLFNTTVVLNDGIGWSARLLYQTI